MSSKSNNPVDLSEDQLIDILLTVDGQGEQVKAAALNELLKRAYDEGLGAGLKVY